MGKKRRFFAWRWAPLLIGIVGGCAEKAVQPAWMDANEWILTTSDSSSAELRPVAEPEGTRLQLDYRLQGEHGWVQLKKVLAPGFDAGRPLTFRFRAAGPGTLEIKGVDADGSVFWVRVPLNDQFADWRRITIYPSELQYGWGGNNELNELVEYHLVVSGQGAGRVWFDDIRLGRAGQPSSIYVFPGEREQKDKAEPGLHLILSDGPRIDPDRDLPGIGFRQRRADRLIPEDPLVLAWLKQLQDVGSPERALLLTTPNDNECQTFNNALVAIAFLLKGEKERAERILDFFAAATRRDNTDSTLQNFFLNGEARGFFQRVEMHPTPSVQAYHHNGSVDRWMGDMAWLLIAYKYYEQQHGPARYAEISDLLKALLVSWYVDSPDVAGGGYVRHGWRKGDQYLHEENGHPEGNIDCYAVFRLVGENEKAEKIRTWLEALTQGQGQPLDIYTWRVQAYDGERCELLDIPDHDLRYRKTVEVNGTPVMGVYAAANIEIDNLWLDGLGHIACAYAACGNRERARFYANQYDPFLMDVELHGVQARSLPYTANEQGGFHFDQTQGFLSPVAWYIFAKNGFNPMTLRRNPLGE